MGALVLLTEGVMVGSELGRMKIDGEALVLCVGVEVIEG